MENVKDSENKTIWFLRHAQSTANKDRIVQGHFDTPLTELGLQQAHLTGLYFLENKENFAVTNVFSSDLQRAKQTAAQIANKLGLTIQTDKRLREAFFGRWEGVSVDELIQQEPVEYAKWMEDKTWRPSWCESFDSIKERAFAALHEITQLEGNTVIVTHGGVLQAIFYTLLNLLDCPPSQFTSRPAFSNCGISCLVQNDWVNGFSVCKVNSLAPGVTETIQSLMLENTFQR